MKNLLLSFMLIFSAGVVACGEDPKAGFVEENSLDIPVDSKHVSGINQEQFNSVINRIETYYSPLISSMGGNLLINRKWEDGTVNANAFQTPTKWIVNMYGGLARHHTITPDGLSLVLCHELGHHIGGAPKLASYLSKWSSYEGQADYFATLKCLRRIFSNDNNLAIISHMTIPSTLADFCIRAHRNRDDAAICIRTGMAGMSVANLFAALRHEAPPKFETPDSSVVIATSNAHPAHQCRLDTYFQGALCGVSFNEDVSQSEEVQGTCHVSLGHTYGVRPRCWFRPR